MDADGGDRLLETVEITLTGWKKVEVSFWFFKGAASNMWSCQYCFWNSDCQEHYYWTQSANSWVFEDVFTTSGAWTKAVYRVIVSKSDAIALKWWTGYSQVVHTGMLALDSLLIVSIPVPEVTTSTEPPATGGSVYITGDDFEGECYVTIDDVISSTLATVINSTILSVDVPVSCLAFCPF